MIDYLIGAFILLVCFMKAGYIQNVIFVFGIIGLWCVSMALKPKRKFKSLEITLLLLMGLASVFYNAYTISSQSIMFKYMNVYLLSEGFIYLLTGVMLLKIIIEHMEDNRVYLLTILLCSVPLLLETTGRFTIPFAFIVSMFMYFLINKKWKIAGLIAGMSGILLFINFQQVMFKWFCRPLVWKEMCGKIFERPFIGHGFNKTLLPTSMIWVNEGNYGYIYRHNDYLALGMDLGIIAMLILIAFLLKSYLSVYKKPISIVLLTFLICSIFQSTMYSVYHAILGITVLSLCIIKGGLYASEIEEAKEAHGYCRA